MEEHYRDAGAPFLSGRAGDEWQAPIGRGCGGKRWIPSKILYMRKKTPLLNIKIHHILDRIGYLSLDIIH